MYWYWVAVSRFRGTHCIQVRRKSTQFKLSSENNEPKDWILSEQHDVEYGRETKPVGFLIKHADSFLTTLKFA